VEGSIRRKNPVPAADGIELDERHAMIAHHLLGEERLHAAEYNDGN